jgi:peptide/nickel transport system permease protein
MEVKPDTAPAPLPTALPARRQRLLWLAPLLQNPKALIGGGIVLFFVLLALFAPVISPGDPNKFVGAANLPPSSQYWLGTTSLGKDVFKQLVWGARGSLLVGFGTALVATAVAVVIGMSAGYFRGWVDDLLSLLMNLFLVIPGLPLLIVVSGYLRPGTFTVIMVLAFTGWAFAARIFRAQTLSLREKDFVAASKVSGEGSAYIIFREVLPNMTSIIVGSTIGGVTYGISAATALSFLGLTDTSEVTWGTNLYWAQNGNALLLGTWWTFIPSGLCVALVAFGLSLITYAMDEITNPRLRAEKEVRNVITSPALRRARATPVLRRAR